MFVTSLRSVLEQEGKDFSAIMSGKIKMVVLVIAVLALILSPGHPRLLLMGQAALWVVVIAALVSAADYFRRFNTILSLRVADFPAEAQRKREAQREIATESLRHRA